MSPFPIGIGRAHRRRATRAGPSPMISSASTAPTRSKTESSARRAPPAPTPTNSTPRPGRSSSPTPPSTPTSCSAPSPKNRPRPICPRTTSPSPTEARTSARPSARPATSSCGRDPRAFTTSSTAGSAAAWGSRAHPTTRFSGCTTPISTGCGRSGRANIPAPRPMCIRTTSPGTASTTPWSTTSRAIRRRGAGRPRPPR